MPAAPSSSPPSTGTGITKLTNCRLVINDSLISSDLFVNSQTGKIISPSNSGNTLIPNLTIDLQNRIVSPGLIDCQLNGAFGFNFSSFTSSTSYIQNIHTLNTKLVRTGVTSYLPTLTSQRPELYHSVLPHLGPLPPSAPGTSHSNDDDDRKKRRNPQNGSESLGAHVEGPFLSPFQHGIHDLSVLRTASSWSDLEQVYGHANLSHGNIKLITIAPELTSPNGNSITTLIPTLSSHGVIISLGHTQCSLPQASLAVRSGAKMITHLFNAMRPLHHRDPGLFGLLGLPGHQKRELIYYGVIADGIHLHPSVVAMAYNLHPGGFILVTDAMHLMGMEDGRYEWVNGRKKEWIEKREGRVFIAGAEASELAPSLLDASSASSPDLSGSTSEGVSDTVSQGERHNSEEEVHGAVNGDDDVTGKLNENGNVQEDKTTNGRVNGLNKHGKRCNGHNNGEQNDGTNGQVEEEEKKQGSIAGSSTTLLQCLNNLLSWTDLSIPQALASVTSIPAEMLNLRGVKGCLDPGADADLVVFEEVEIEVDDMLDGGKVRRKQLVLQEVWKFGVRVFWRGWDGDGVMF